MPSTLPQWLPRIFAAAAVAAAILLPAPDVHLVAGGFFQGTEIRGDHFPKTLIDAIGRHQTIARPPRRIASAILAADETLSRLVDPGRVVGVTYLVDDAGISNVPDFYAPSVFRNHGDPEELLSLDPDLIIMAGYSEASAVRQLLGTDIPLLRLPDFQSIADIENHVRLLGAATGAEQRAEAIIADMRARIAAIGRALANRPRPRVLFYSASGSTSGSNTLDDETLTLAGGFNVMREMAIEGPTRISQEAAIGLQPDVILLVAWGPHEGEETASALRASPAWNDVPAVRNNRIYVLSGAPTTTVTPFRVLGIEHIARLLHPGVFTDGVE